jgi:hypothetical protein
LANSHLLRGLRGIEPPSAALQKGLVPSFAIHARFSGRELDFTTGGLS